MEVVAFTDEHQQLILDDPSRINPHPPFTHWEIFQAGSLRDEKDFEKYRAKWHTYSMIHNEEFVGHFGIRFKEGGAQISKAFIPLKHRGRVIDGKKICVHLGELSVAKAKELYPGEARIWCVVYDIDFKGRNYPNKGKACWESIGFEEVDYIKIDNSHIPATGTVYHKYIYEYKN